MTAGTTTKEDDNVGMEQWDLTSSISPYLDRHMMFPLLEYLDTLIDNGILGYNKKDVAAARLSLLRPTHMVDYAIDIYKGLHGENATIPPEMQEQKKVVYERLEELRAGCSALEELCNNKEERAKLTANGEWNAVSLIQNSFITEESLETYRQLAKYKYECGDYQASREMLENYISLLAKPPATSTSQEDDDLFVSQSTSNKNKSTTSNTETGNESMYYLETITPKMLQVLWGKLACDVLVEDWPAASIAVDAVKTAIELLVSQKEISPLEALKERTWLLHWSLFVYWNDTNLESLVTLFFSERYKQAITTNAPHLLRYLVAAVLIIKRRTSGDVWRLLKNLVHVMQDCEYTDPIVDFVNCLLVKFDFELAQTKLQECQGVLDSDFFLCKQTHLFMEEARVFVFENYCRIHDKIDLSALGAKLAMSPEDAERWIVDLIRNADLDAKIDSQENCVVMGGSSQSVYQQVMERTRDLNVRSATLAQNLNNVMADARKEKAKKERAARELEE